MLTKSAKTRVVALLVGAATSAPGIARGAEPAVAVGVAGPEAERRELERTSKLDLSREWSAYQQGKPTQPFAEFVDRRYRLRRDVGRGLVMAGVGLIVFGGFFLSLGVSDRDGKPMTNISFATLAVGGGATIVGGALWGVYFRRLERLGDPAIALGPRLRLTSAAPIILPQGGGLGVRLAF